MRGSGGRLTLFPFVENFQEFIDTFENRRKFGVLRQ
jgi:hypothetical protein